MVFQVVGWQLFDNWENAEQRYWEEGYLGLNKNGLIGVT